MDFGVFSQGVAVAVLQLVADATGGYNLVVYNAVLFSLDDMATSGQTGNGHGAIGCGGNAFGGEAAEGHYATHGGASNGDVHAFGRLEAVLCAFIAHVEQDIELGVDSGCALSLLHAGKHHVGLNGASIANVYHKNAGKLRPGSAEPVVVIGGTLTATIGHGVVGHQHQRGTVCVSGQVCHAGIVGIGSDGNNVRSVAVHIDDLVVSIGDSHLGVHVAFDGVPVAEHVHLEGVTRLHIQAASGVDVQVHVAHVVLVGEAAVHGGLGHGCVTNMQLICGNGDSRVSGPLVVTPEGHTLGMLHAVVIVLALGDGEGVVHRAVFSSGGLTHFLVAIHVVLGQSAHAQSRALGHVEGHLNAFLAAHGDGGVGGDGGGGGANHEGGMSLGGSSLQGNGITL